MNDDKELHVYRGFKSRLGEGEDRIYILYLLYCTVYEHDFKCTFEFTACKFFKTRTTAAAQEEDGYRNL